MRRALDSANLQWRVVAAWVKTDNLGCMAELIDERTGKARTVALSRNKFPTATERRKEIVRQVQAFQGQGAGN